MGGFLKSEQLKFDSPPSWLAGYPQGWGNGGGGNGDIFLDYPMQWIFNYMLYTVNPTVLKSNYTYTTE